MYPGAWSKMRVDLCSHVIHDSVALALEQSGQGHTIATAVSAIASRRLNIASDVN